MDFSALYSCMNVKTALMNTTPTIANPRVSIPSPGCRYSDKKASPAPIQSKIARKWVNCLRNLMDKAVFFTSLISFRPNSESLFFASSSVRPFSDVTRRWRTLSFVRLLIFIAGFKDYQVTWGFPEDILNRVSSQDRG